MINDIEKLIHERDWVTFAELSRLVEGFNSSDSSAGYVLAIGDRGKFLWANMSEAAVNTVLTLLNEQRAALAPSQVLTYLIDGMTFNNKKWMPVTLRPPEKANHIGFNKWLVYDPRRKSQSKAYREAIAGRVAT